MGVAGKSLFVNLGEVIVTCDQEAILSCMGIGSCIAVCMYDPKRKVGGMAHVVLPKSNGAAANAKYADIAIPLLIKNIREQGGEKFRLVVKIVGGAQMATSTNNNSAPIGTNNVSAVTASLSDAGLKIAAADTGGNFGRSVQLNVGTGQVFTRMSGKQFHELV